MPILPSSHVNSSKITNNMMPTVTTKLASFLSFWGYKVETKHYTSETDNMRVQSPILPNVVVTLSVFPSQKG